MVTHHTILKGYLCTISLPPTYRSQPTQLGCMYLETQGETNPSLFEVMIMHFRTNQNPALLSFGILFYRWHNVLARRVQLKHPTWSDEDIFQVQFSPQFYIKSAVDDIIPECTEIEYCDTSKHHCV